MNQGIQFLIPTGAPATRPEGAAAGGQGAAGPPGAFRSLLLSALLGEAAPGPQAQIPTPTLVAVPPEGAAAQVAAAIALPTRVESGVPTAEPTLPLSAQLPATVPFPPASQSASQAQPPQAPTAPMTRPDAAALVALLIQSSAPTEGQPAETVPETAEPAPDEVQQGLVGAEAFAQATAAAVQTPIPVQQAPEPVPQTQPRSDHAQGLAAAPDPSTAQLEAFVQQAVAVVQRPGEEPAPKAETPDKPHFADLLTLVAEAEGAPQQVQSAANSVDAQPQFGRQGEAPHQSAGDARFQAPQPAVAEPLEPIATVEPTAEPTHASVELKPHHPVVETAEALPSDSKPPVQPEPVLRQVTRFVKVMVESDRSEVRLNLHPEELGTIVVKLVLEGGTVKAHLTAQDAAVKHVLETNLDQLKTRFANQGITVNEVQVAVGDNGSSFSQPQHSHHGGRQQQNQPQSRPGHAQAPQQEEPQPGHQPQQPALWTRRWSGSRINSLA